MVVNSEALSLCRHRLKATAGRALDAERCGTTNVQQRSSLQREQKRMWRVIAFYKWNGNVN